MHFITSRISAVKRPIDFSYLYTIKSCQDWIILLHKKKKNENMHQMPYAKPTVTILLEMPVTRKLPKAPLPTMCASTFVVSHPDGACTMVEKPQGYGDMNGQVLTFDSSVLYHRLWINDSKGPHPGGLMCSARLRAAHGEPARVSNVPLTLYSTVIQWQGMLEQGNPVALSFKLRGRVVLHSMPRWD